MSKNKDIFIICGTQSLPSFYYRARCVMVLDKITDYPLAYKRRINRDFEKVCENKQKIHKYIKMKHIII